MIKQFNFYDIYGYLLPGSLLLGILWLPLGILTRSLPSQDLSKAVFLAGLAYILGHLIQTVANSLVPSKVNDPAGHMRAPSELFLDHANDYFGQPFKLRLEAQVRKLFGLNIAVAQDGDGNGAVSKERQVAFFQARSYLIAKKAASYLEQFEGLYVMMRGLGCSFCVGAAYIAGWELAFHRGEALVWVPLAVLYATALLGTLMSVWGQVFHWPRLKYLEKPVVIASLWLSVFFCSGFWAGFLQPAGFWQKALPYSALILWISIPIALIAAAKCFAGYKKFASDFAATVWRDFSACLAYGESPASPSGSAKAPAEEASEAD